jgi:cardiolipin synthase
MSASAERGRAERQTRAALRGFAGRALSRAAGAPLIEGNHVRLLKDARENYPAWLDAIHTAKHHVHFESYIIHEDDTGRQFAETLIAKAREGVQVRLIYDWMGGFGKASRRFWRHLRSGGVEVRCYNPPRFDSPLGWMSRDHRKMLAVDCRIGFITGLCVGRMWTGDPERRLDPWRDTGVEVRGPAVSEIEQAFSQIWATMGKPVPHFGAIGEDSAIAAGDMSVRIVASLPATTGMMRLDELVSTLAEKTLWLSDAYYAATSSYVQALRAAAKDGVDVRLLVPNGTDIPILRPISQAGYRPLLEAGVRVFEWNGTMLHAKTAVADKLWARVGSTNLNLASWMTNYELDVAIEDPAFAETMTTQFERDLSNTTEIVLTRRNRVRPMSEVDGAPGHDSRVRPNVRRSLSGSANRAAAGAVSVGSALGAALTNRRALGATEAGLLFFVSAIVISIGIVAAFWPRVLAWPLAFICAWLGIAWGAKAVALKRRAQRQAAEAMPPAAKVSAAGSKES